MLFKREKYLKKIRPFYDADDLIKVITGVRRCGKSCLMQTIADELISKGIDPDDIVYLDLDKRGNRKIKTADQLEQLIDRKIQKEGFKYVKYVATTDYNLQKRNGIQHINIVNHMASCLTF